jgi:ABC-type glycerol-3-phosphate transport system substrate-binding protein
MGAFVDTSSCQFDTVEFYETLEFIRDYAEGNGGKTIGYGTWVFGIPGYASDKQNLGITPQYVGYPDSDRNGPCAFALTSFGISSSTEFPDECWEFIKQITDVDSYLNYFSSLGFSLSYQAMNEALELYSYPTDDTRSPMYGMTNDEEEYYSPISIEDYDIIYSLLDSITHARYRYDGIFQIIREEGQAYFAGDQSTADTAQFIQNRARIYLSEQS